MNVMLQELFHLINPELLLTNTNLEARPFGISSIKPRFCQSNGKASQTEINAFFKAGYTEVQTLEVILGLAVKVMSNYTNPSAGTPLDLEVEKLR